MTNNKQNSGFVLLMVMLVLMISTIILSSVYKYGEIARLRYSGNRNERQAFWCAEAGMTQIKVMAETGMRPFGQNGLPNPGTAVINGSLGGGTYKVDVEVVSQNRYTFTSTGICNGQTNIITTTAFLEPYNVAVLSTANDPKSPVWFTPEDALIGPIYIDGPFNVYKSNNKFPAFQGDVRTTAGHVNFNPGGKVSYLQGAVDEVFTAGIYLNSPELDFTGANSSDFIQDIRDAADLTLNGNHTVTLLANGTLEYKKEGANKTTTVSISSLANNTVYVNGQLTISGQLNGELTIGCNNKVIVEDAGLRYASAPSGYPDSWSENEINSIDDYLGIVTKNNIVCKGTDPIELHGSFMVTSGGIYPEQRGEPLTSVNGVKPKMYLLGSIAQADFEHTEQGGGRGFGTYWIYDKRLDRKILSNYPARGYKFSGWISENKNKNQDKDKGHDKS